MIRTLFLVPTRDNDGRRFDLDDWRALDERIGARFGGYTEPPPVRGVWRAGSRTYRDVNRQFVIALDSWEQLPEWLDLVRWARTRFRQEAVYIEVAGIPGIIGAPREVP